MRRSFDLLALPYRWMEYVTFGRHLQRCREFYLPDLSATRNALLLGDGDGRFAAALLRAAPKVKITAIDSSAAMLAALQQQCRHADGNARVILCLADLRCGLPATVMQQTYDLVVTHFSLDCLNDQDLQQLVRQLVPRIKPAGRWVLSEFNVPQTHLRLIAKLLIRLLYFAFRLLTGLQTQRLPDHRTPLTQAGMRQNGAAQMLGGILIAEVWCAPIKASPSS